MTEEELRVIMSEMAEEDILESNVGNDGTLAYKFTPRGWMALARVLRESGHPNECPCEECDKTYQAVSRFYISPCGFCGQEVSQPYVKGPDLMHCGKCHGKRCSPRAPDCCGGPGQPLILSC